MTSKGQVTVPKAIRDQLNLKAGDRVQFLIDDDGTARMVPVTRSVRELKGMTPAPARALSLEEMDTVIQRGARDE